MDVKHSKKSQPCPISILPVPIDQTYPTSGSALAPAAILEGLKQIEFHNPDLHFDSENLSLSIENSIDCSQSVKQIQNVVHKKINELITKKHFVVTLGGDHSVNYPSIMAHRNHYEELSVLRLDAHANLHPKYDGNKLSASSSTARLLEIPDLKNIVSVGIRSLSSKEAASLNDNLTVYSHEIFNNQFWIEKVSNNLSNNVYISIDLDVFDPGIFSFVGAPEPGGLYWHHITDLIKSISLEKNIVGLDFVELYPETAQKYPGYFTAKLMYQSLCYIMHGKSNQYLDILDKVGSI